MFKLESYITPIILNHVAKYVKNIRPEDSQVSLWEGEVAFQNLDLHLDVLEEELKLPFEFLSGHIHELSIQVPWLKITSEPIKITINTIEFVLKLKNKDKEEAATASPQNSDRRLSKPDEQQQQGYMPGMVFKIINNIVINCHNIILKYVEEDIVVSMNIQLLSLNSADESWKAAFTDINPIKVFMRKLIQVSDLTICLDKRNAAGQIDVCQEPILYRCSLEIRVVLKYNANSAHQSRSTKIAIFTKLMEMNVSSLQFPMAMRLFKLAMALKDGELKSKSATDVNEEEVEAQESLPSVPSSFLNWAWNLIPNLGFNEPEEPERSELDESGKLMDIGVYIDTLNFTLKSSEFITDSIVGATKKIRYSPIVRLSLGGIYSETIILAEKNWSNTKAGCSSISVEPLGAYRDEESDLISIVSTPTPHHKTFLDRSLFDDTFIEKDWIVTGYDDYNLRVTEKYLLYRSPVIAFDLIEYKEAAKTTNNDPEIENEDNRNRVVYRVLASEMTLRYNQTFTRIATVLQELIRTYDYPPYTEEKPEASGGSPKLHPPLADDYESLMTGIPLKVFKFNLSAINIEFHPKTEQAAIKSAKKLSLTSKKALPYFKFAIDSIEGQFSMPLKPDKLVHTTCQLPDKPIELLNACYKNTQLRLKNISLTLNRKSLSSELFSIPKASINFGELIQPSLWKNEEVPSRKLDVAFDSIILEFSKMELITALRLIDSFSEFDLEKLKQIDQQKLHKKDKTVKIRSQFKKLYIEMKKYLSTTMYRGSLKALQAITLRCGFHNVKTNTNNILLTTIGGGQRKKWLDWYVQIPNECAQGTCTKSVVALWTEEYHLHVDEDLEDFLKVEESSHAPKPAVPEPTPSTSRAPLMKQSSRKSTASERQSRRICCPEETVHLSSDREEKVNVEKTREKELQEQFSYIKMLPYIKNMVIKVQMANGNVTITSESSRRSSKHSKYTQITLPRIIFCSSVAENLTRYNVQSEFQNSTGKSPKDTFPWTCGICDFSVQSSANNEIRTIVHPIQTSVTVAMTHKKETLNLPKNETQPQPKAAPAPAPTPPPPPPPAPMPAPTTETTEEPNEERSSPSPHLSASSSLKETEREMRASLKVFPPMPPPPPPEGSVSVNARTSAGSEESEHTAAKLSEKKRSYLQEAVETVFSSKRRSSQRDVVSVSVHVDTSPIRIEFDADRTTVIHDHLSLLLKVLSSFKSQNPKPVVERHKTIQIVTNNEENPDIKQFMEMETNSESSLLTSDKPMAKFMLSMLFQWTVTRISLELDTLNSSQCKLVLEMEDVITSVDKQYEFTKFTCKIGTMNSRFYEADEKNVLSASDRFKIKVQNDATQSPLFNMVVTTVGINNFLKKVGVKRREIDPTRNIVEIYIKMEAIEIICDMDKLAIVAPVIFPLMENDESPHLNKVHSPTRKHSTPCTTCELPMIHLESKGLTIYLPANTKTSWCSVSILKIEAIKISPNLENPLQRSPIRTDVFQKAAQMRILGIPGSMIEDRQYEMTFQNISAATGNWDEILKHMKEHSDNFHSTNPAFEWNNQSRKTSLDVRKIFSNFTFIIIYAPCITCNNVLICGQALEFNCSNDLIISLTTDQVSLFSCISSKVLGIVATMDRNSNLHKSKPGKSSPSTSTQSLDECNGCTFTISATCSKVKEISPQPSSQSSEKLATDSGISSGEKKLPQKVSTKPPVNCQEACVRLMPHTTTFVAGIFIINLYNYRRDLIGIPQGDEVSIEEILTPLLTITLSQPNFLVSQSIYEITKRFSLFNLAVNLFHSENLSIEQLHIKEQKQPSVILFDTKQGVADSSGIPPSFLVINSRTTKNHKLEVDINVAKPATLRLTHNSLQSLTKHVILYSKAFLENPGINIRTEKPIVRATKIQMIKNMFLNADHFNFKLNKISVKYFEAYSLKLNAVDVKFSTKFKVRPEKMHANGSIGGLYLQSNNTIAVHPIGFRAHVDLVQEPWNRLPMVMANIKFNVIHFDIGMMLVRNCSLFTKVLNEEVETCKILWEEFVNSQSNGDKPHVNPERLLKVTLPAIEPKKISEQKDEFYQDDLRAGAFQFIELDSDSLQPIPYQIQIIKKNFGIICWRYPQPRKMSSIHVFPVPMPTSNPIRIKCRMEYFSELHGNFLHYCDFWLSETVSKSIVLPILDVTANVWRVVILQSLVSINKECFDATEEDDELRSIISIGIDDILNSAKKESDFILHPKVLVGCMRIDTVFRPSSIPKLQLLVIFNEVQLNLQNIQNMKSKLPIQLKKLKLTEHLKPIDQTFLSLCLENTSFHLAFHTLEHYSVHSEVNMSAKCLDYGYLNLIHVLDKTKLTGKFLVNGAIDTNINVDKLTLQLGPSILHNLICAKQNWESFFSEESEGETFIISKFIVANRTYSNIYFGQTGTDERILLESKECCKYSFQSDKHHQELTFYIKNGDQTETASNSLVVTFDFPDNSERKVNHVLIDDKCLAIRTRKLSATQYYILIKGQIEVVSMVKDEFTLEFYEDDKRTAHDEVNIAINARSTLMHPVTFESNLCIRLKLADSRGRGQTGNIPLKANKNYPWLVKVPINGPQKFISYWVRVIRECIPDLRTETFHPQKILIVIWPIFEICSMLTTEIQGKENTTNEEFVVRPMGRCHQLRLPATHLTEHDVSFQNGLITAPPFTLTLKAIDWNRFFWYDEDEWTVENSLSELSKPVVPKWPISDEEELRIRRVCLPNCETTLLYKCSQSRDFSCCLSLEIAPWGTFINSSGLTIAVLWQGMTEPLEIASNAMAMLPQIQSEFRFKIPCGLVWMTSLPIVFDSSVDTSKRRCYRITENETADIMMYSCDSIFKFHLYFRTENERNVFILKPKYVVSNMSKYHLDVFPFVLDCKGMIGRKEIRSLVTKKNYPVRTTTTSDYNVGVCMDGFIDLCQCKSPRCPNAVFTFYVCIRVKGKSELSIPILLMEPFNRQCFSIQLNEKSIAFSASLLEKSGQYFLTIFNDSSPIILLSNDTDLTMIVAQTNTCDNTKVSNTIAESDDNHFEWHQLIRPKSELYYTPPTSYINFPDVDTAPYKICIALYIENQKRKSIKWSKAINMDASCEKFLHLPSHGDVKVIVCDKHRIVRVSIQYIAQQLEFSVKELRSRLQTPERAEKLSHAQIIHMQTVSNEDPVQRVKATQVATCIHNSPNSTLVVNKPFKFKFTIKEINAKIFVECKSVDYLKKEVFALYIDDFSVSYKNNTRTLKLAINNLQIDNQMFSSGDYDFPVILCSQEPYKRFLSPCTGSSTSMLNLTPGLVEVSVRFYDDEFKARSVACRVNPIRAYIEDTYLNDLLDYLVDCTPSNVVVSLEDSNFYVELVSGESLIPKDIIAQALLMSEPFRMQYFRIDAMNVLLSVHTCVRLYIALDHSPLQFSSYERRDILTLPLRFGHTIGMHYLSGALFGAGWVVGSLEMLGSPSGLARSFTLGLKDFVSMPVQGLLRGPWGFVVGVAQGSASLLRNITAGTVNSVSKLAASVSRNLDRLTLDREHIQRTEALRRCRPQGFTEGFTQGITGFGISILGAVGGIARHTLEARSPGQVVTGMGKGIVGAFTKPISGAAELLALTGQGVLHTVGFNAMPHQRIPSAPKNIAAQVSEQKIWNLLAGILSTVLEGDQILFYHDVTLIVGGKRHPGSVFLTSSIFALFETDKHMFSFITPTQRLEISANPSDRKILNISVKKQPNEIEEGSFYTTQRIMTFLRSSNQFDSCITTESLDDILKDHRYKIRSLSISEYLGQYLIEYVKIINMDKS